jgi:hypothetical protein
VVGVGLVAEEGMAAAAVLGLVVALATVEGLELGLEEGKVVGSAGVRAVEAASVAAVD